MAIELKSIAKENIPKFKKSSWEILGSMGGMSDDIIEACIKEIYIDYKLVGYIGLSEYRDNGMNALGLGSFMILERGKGYGTQVIEYIVDHYKNQYDLIYCFVDAKNTGAIKLYKKLGKVYDDGEPNENGEYYVVFYNKNNLNEAAENLSLNHEYNSEAPDEDYYVAYADNKKIGYILIDGDYLDAIYVYPEFRGRGYGDKLFKKALELGIKTLSVDPKNNIAINLYKKHNFDIVDQTDKNGQSTYTMQLNEVYPNKGESKKDFIARFMSATKKEYPDIKQRFAVANSYWERRHKTVKEASEADKSFDSKFNHKYVEDVVKDKSAAQNLNSGELIKLCKYLNSKKRGWGGNCGSMALALARELFKLGKSIRIVICTNFDADTLNDYITSEPDIYHMAIMVGEKMYDYRGEITLNDLDNFCLEYYNEPEPIVDAWTYEPKEDNLWAQIVRYNTNYKVEPEFYQELIKDYFAKKQSLIEAVQKTTYGDVNIWQECENGIYTNVAYVGNNWIDNKTDKLLVDNIRGSVEYEIDKNIIYIRMIAVPEKYKRQGFGTLLIKDLQTRYPNKKIIPSDQTDEGNKFFNKILGTTNEPKEKDYVEIAKDTFGTVPISNWKVAFYINTDGTLLDGSGRKFGSRGLARSMDHREIDGIFTDDSEQTGWLRYMNLGNIRLMPEIQGLNLIKEPTEAQYKVLNELITNRFNWDETTVEISNERGDQIFSKTYKKPSEKILTDIKNYFAGKLNYQSDLDQFREELQTAHKGLRLTEDTRNALLNASRGAGQYQNKSKGKNRFDRKKFSKVANQVKSFNKINMNSFFKDDVLEFEVPVNGETNNYTVTIRMEGVVKEIQKNIKANKYKLEYRTVIQALTKVFNSDNVYVKCSCPDFLYRFKHFSIVGKYGVDDSSQDPGPGKGIANPNNDKGKGCKHILLVLSNIAWLMKVGSVLYNYINYAEEHMSKAFLSIIFPKLYGMSPDEALSQEIIDNDKFLNSSSGIIDDINNWAKRRGQFKPGSNKNAVTGTGGRQAKPVDTTTKSNTTQNKSDLTKEEPNKKETKEEDKAE